MTTLTRELKREVFGGLSQCWGIRIAFLAFVMNMWMRRSVRTFVQHDQVVSDHFGGEFFVPFLIFPAACTQSAFDIDQAAFVKIFLCQLGQAPPEDHGMPFCLRNEFASPVFKGLCGSQREFSDGNIT